MSELRSHLTFANAVSTIALFVALGGSSYAALKVTGRDVANSSLTGRDLKEQLSDRVGREERLAAESRL